MKRIKIFSLAVLCVISFGGCVFKKSAKKEIVPPPSPSEYTKPQTEYELYAWKDGEVWNYSLIAPGGFYRNTSIITASKDISKGTDAFIARIGRMQKGTQVLWNIMQLKDFSNPPAGDIEKISSAAKDADVEIVMDSPAL